MHVNADIFVMKVFSVLYDLNLGIWFAASVDSG